MRKLLILIFALIILVALVVFNFTKPTTSDSEVNNNPQDVVSSPIDQAKAETEIALTTEALGPGEYVYYNEDSFSEDINYNKVVLFFYASWCPTCAVLQNELNANQDNIPSGVRIIRVPYDDVSGANQETLALNAKYKVTYQHTLVQIDSSGELIKKWNGSSKLEDIINKIQ